MKSEALRKLAGQEEIDYQFIMSALREYAYPRDKISDWLKSGELIRVKKGLYIFGETVALQPFSREILANLIYGPSAISLTYALSYYDLIPERVCNVTSITNKHNKSFATKIGEFKYYYLSPKKYATGIVLHPLDSQRSFLIASPEKALCDQIYLMDRNYPLHTLEDTEKYLLHDLRVDETLIGKFKLKNLQELCEIYRDARLVLLYNYIKNRK